MFFETATLPEKNLVYVPDTSPVFAYLSRYSSIEVNAISAYCAYPRPGKPSGFSISLIICFKSVM